MVHEPREMARGTEGRADDPTAAILDSRTVQRTPEFGARGGDDGHRKRTGSKVHLAVDTLGHLLTLRVTPADAQDRAQVAAPADAVAEATGETVELAYVDQAYTGPDPAATANAHGIALEVIRLPEAKSGFVPLARRLVVERSFAWASRFRRLVRDYERLPGTVAGPHFVAFACLMTHRLITFAGERAAGVDVGRAFAGRGRAAAAGRPLAAVSAAQAGNGWDGASLASVGGGRRGARDRRVRAEHRRLADDQPAAIE